MKGMTIEYVFPFDPVCGENLVEGKEGVTTKNGKGLYGFCSEECRDLFLANPDMFIFYREREGKRNI